MSVSLSRVDGPGDAELIAAVRGGDVDAYGELFARHVDAARRLARQLAGPGDADDLVSDAFTKVLTVLQRGGGPDLAFRAYLLTAVRRLHVDRIRSGSRLRPVDDLTPFDPGVPFHDTAVEGFDNATAAKAFASLPERWQMVLWHTEVEQQKPADIAVLLGMSANSVSALAYRAREGLRQAFLSMHAADPDDIDCGWTRDHLGAYVRGGLSRRDVARVDDHLEDCRTCAAVYLELTEVNSGLSALLAPLLLGAAGAKYASSIGGGAAAGGAGTSGFAAVQAWAAAHAGLTIIGGFAVAATAVLAVYGANHLQGHGAADVGSGALSGVPSASSGQSPDGNAPGSTSSRGTDGTGQPGDTSSSQGATDTASPGADASLTPSTDPTSGSTDTTTSSTDPTTNQTDPTTNPTDPTTSPTDPTTAPTDPGDDPITFTSVPPIDPVFGSTYQVKATSTSGRAVTFSVDGTPATACAITGDLVSFDHAGTCVISARPTARNAARVGVAARPTSKVFSQTVVIPRAKQTIDFRIGKGAQVDGKLALTASGGPSGKDVTFTSDTPGVCSVNAAGNAVVFRHALQCTVTAHQDGNEDYRPAQDVSDRVDVAKGDQTIDFTQVTAGKVGTDAPLTATSSAGLTVHFATTDAACTVAGSTVTFVHASPCSVTARAGNADYNDATATQQVDVAKGDQTIDFTQVTAGKVGTDAPLTATSSAGLDITFDATSDACTVAGSTVTFVHASPCSVTAKAGNADYNDTTATQQVDVAKGDQTIDFTLTSDRAVVNGTGTLAVTAQGDSGNPVNFTSSTPGACTVTGSTVTFDHAQACSVEATQPESDDYNAASAVTHTLQVGKADQQVAFTSTPPPDPTLHGLYTVSAIGGDSGNPVTFTSTTPDICTVTGTTVALDHAGTCTVAADQAGDDDYLAAPTVTRDITINKASQAISFTLPTAPALGSSHDLVATGGGSGNTVTFTTTTPDQCSVTGSTVTFDHAGICVIAADQAGNDDYEAAPAVIQSVGVAKAAQSITFTSQAPADPAFGGTYVVTRDRR